MSPQYRNRVLGLLPPDEQISIGNRLELVPLDFKQILAEAGDRFENVHFVDSGLVSLVNHVSGSLVEVGTVGSEGIVGLSLFLDDGVAAHRAFVQVPGEAWQLDADAVADIAAIAPSLERLVRRFTQASLIQVSQTAACNLIHTIEQRCAQWLLITHDSAGSDVFPITQEFMAFMLGVRRAGVTVAAGLLQKHGFIRYARGKVTVLDRGGLENASCECYRVVRDQFSRLLPLGLPASDELAYALSAR